jgi:hypothetical protein
MVPHQFSDFRGFRFLGDPPLLSLPFLPDWLCLPYWALGPLRMGRLGSSKVLSSHLGSWPCPLPQHQHASPQPPKMLEDFLTSGSLSLLDSTLGNGGQRLWMALVLFGCFKVSLDAHWLYLVLLFTGVSLSEVPLLLVTLLGPSGGSCG